jgi:hypothetical protein
MKPKVAKKVLSQKLPAKKKGKEVRNEMKCWDTKGIGAHLLHVSRRLQTHMNLKKNTPKPKKTVGQKMG